SVAALHHHHSFNGSRIDSANRTIQVNSAKELDTGDNLPDDVSQCRGRFIVILQHQPAHAARLRQLREIDRINGTRSAVRSAMRMNIDHAIKPWRRLRW